MQNKLRIHFVSSVHKFWDTSLLFSKHAKWKLRFQLIDANSDWATLENEINVRKYTKGFEFFSKKFKFWSLKI